MRLEVKNDFKTLTTQEIYNKYLLGQEVWFFKEYLKVDNPSKQYDDFKHYIAKNLNIHFNNIAITGSAKTGISFSPKKKLKYFDENSDIDIILVSSNHYNLFWSAYLDMFYRQTVVPEYTLVATSLFKGFISMKSPTEKHRIIKEWIKTVDPLVKDLQMFFGIERAINYRIYNSWETVEKYHYFGIKQLNNYLLNSREKEEKISSIITNLQNYKNGST